MEGLGNHGRGWSVTRGRKSDDPRCDCCTVNHLFPVFSPLSVSFLVIPSLRNSHLTSFKSTVPLSLPPPQLPSPYLYSSSHTSPHLVITFLSLLASDFIQLHTVPLFLSLSSSASLSLPLPFFTTSSLLFFIPSLPLMSQNLYSSSVLSKSPLSPSAPSFHPSSYESSLFPF